LQNGGAMKMQALVSIVLAGLVLAGCALDGTEEETTSTTEQGLSGNVHAAYDYFVARGLTKRQSAGIVGNLMQESSVIPTAVQFGGGPGRGIAQWSVGGRWDHSYHDNVTWYAAHHSESRWALHTQLAFTWYELHSVGGYGLGALRNTRTIRGATLVFMRDYEICGTCDSSRRVQYAQQVYNAYAATGRTIDVDDLDTDAEEAVDVAEDPDAE
jgi:hypothetical protein